MTIDGTGSCACSVINGIGYASKGAKVTLLDFFKTVFGTAVPKFGAKLNTLSAHYVFTAGPGNYGRDFAALIENEKLGKVATLDVRQNPLYGRNHPCQVWIWQPDQKACEAWWLEKNKDIMAKIKKEEEARQLKAQELLKKHGDKAFTVQTYGANPDQWGIGVYGNHVGGVVQPTIAYNIGGTPERVYLKNRCYCEKGKMELGMEYLIVDYQTTSGQQRWTLVESPKPEVPSVTVPAPVVGGSKLRWKIDDLTGKRKYYYEDTVPVGGVINA